MASDKGPVVVTLTCEAREGTDTQEIDRAEWDAMTPARRRDLLASMAEEHVNNQGGYGWHITDPADLVAAEAGYGKADPVEAAREVHRLTDGLIVSVDMSTGDHDHAARVYGRIVGAQEDGAGSPMLLAEVVEDARSPDPLRELAEWLVSLDGHPLMIDRPTPDDMRAIVRRAREALGKEG